MSTPSATAADPWGRFTTLEDFLHRARRRLDPIEGRSRLPETGDGELLPPDQLDTLRPAGVLVAVVPRPGGPTAVLTQRPDTMANHPGQVAFAGGKVDPTDHDEVAAALREAHEEVGVDPDTAVLIGRGAPYVTGTGFRIVPVVALLPDTFVARPCPTEVAAAFETPLAFLMNPANHQRHSGTWKGQTRSWWEMPHGGFRIWGVTAGIVRELYLRLYGR